MAISGPQQSWTVICSLLLRPLPSWLSPWVFFFQYPISTHDKITFHLQRRSKFTSLNFITYPLPPPKSFLLYKERQCPLLLKKPFQHILPLHHHCCPFHSCHLRNPLSRAVDSPHALLIVSLLRLGSFLPCTWLFSLQLIFLVVSAEWNSGSCTESLEE